MVDAIKSGRRGKTGAADPAAPKQRGRPFLPGQSGNPAGRAKGSRNKLSEAFMSDMLEMWEKHGQQAMRKVIKDRPHEFMKAVASLVPKSIDLEPDAVDALAALMLAVDGRSRALPASG